VAVFRISGLPVSPEAPSPIPFTMISGGETGVARFVESAPEASVAAPPGAADEPRPEPLTTTGERLPWLIVSVAWTFIGPAVAAPETSAAVPRTAAQSIVRYIGDPPAPTEHDPCAGPDRPSSQAPCRNLPHAQGPRQGSVPQRESDPLPTSQGDTGGGCE